MKEYLITFVIAIVTSYFVTTISENKKHSIKLKFDLYTDFIDNFANLFIHRDNPEQYQNKLIELFNRVSLLSSEGVAKEILQLRILITEFARDKDNDSLLKLEIQLSKVKNAMRKDIGLVAFKDLKNGFALFTNPNTADKKTKN
jgi:hypothetical protein